jgi:transposase
MNKISVIGLDLAKNVFQVHGVDIHGEVVVRKQLTRSQVRKFFAQLEPCLVGMEACGGAHYWSRELTRLGHTVRLMAPAFVKAYLKSNKKTAMTPKPPARRYSGRACALSGQEPWSRPSCICIMDAAAGAPTRRPE